VAKKVNGTNQIWQLAGHQHDRESLVSVIFAELDKKREAN